MEEDLGHDQPRQQKNCQQEKRLRKKWRFQVNLLTILLLVSASGVWIAHRRARLDTDRIESQLSSLRLLARELIIEDTNEFAAITRMPALFDEMIWDVYVPPLNGSRMRLCVAMDEISDDEPFGVGEKEPLQQCLLPAGEHVVEHRYSVCDEYAVLTVLIDGEPTLEVQRPKAWVNSGGWSGASSIGSSSMSFQPDRTIPLLHRRFMVDDGTGSSRVPKGPCAGILLWVEPMQDDGT